MSENNENNWTFVYGIVRQTSREDFSGGTFLNSLLETAQHLNDENVLIEVIIYVYFVIKLFGLKFFKEKA